MSLLACLHLIFRHLLMQFKRIILLYHGHVYRYFSNVASNANTGDSSRSHLCHLESHLKLKMLTCPITNE